jgi:hypothetical protein
MIQEEVVETGVSVSLDARVVGVLGWLGWFPGAWFLPVMVLVQIGDLLLSYYWWRRDLSKAETVPPE